MATAKKSDLVYEYLMDAIASEKWKCGEKIPSENQLCEITGVSRVSVRSAISRLTSYGILRSRRGEGTFVCEKGMSATMNGILPTIVFGDYERINIFEFRKIIEVESAGLAALRATAEMVEGMKKATQRMQTLSDVAEGANADLEFHRLIAFATSNPVIIKVFELLENTYLHVLEENVARLGAFGADMHLMIISAIEARNAQAAKEYMEKHLNNTIQNVVEMQ